MKFISTRGSGRPVDFAQAMKQAMASDGGLFVPEKLPVLDPEPAANSYWETALGVLRAFVPELEEAGLSGALQENYRAFPIPVVQTDAGTFLELFHGPTGAFKDVALTMLPRLEALTGGGETVYVTATSGDTGKAALEAFRNQPGTRIMVFYPEEGVSHLQKLQMQTQQGDNVSVVAIRGNFDDAQRGVKAILQEFSGQGVSSCNSINIARLLTQIPYYFEASRQLGQRDLSFLVPTGNFGDILAGWYAKAMGLPVKRLIAVTNDNRVLEEFLRTGRYDRRRPLVKTSSPSMDILVSSNVERLLFHCFGPQETRRFMDELRDQGFYQADPASFRDFDAQSASEEEVQRAIRTVYEEAGYLMDPHTACAWAAWDQLGRPADHVILATASPFKFPAVIQEALTGQRQEEREALAYLSSLAPVHPALAGILERPVRFDRTIDPQEMREEFLRFMGGVR